MVIDRLKVQAKDEERLQQSVRQSLQQGEGLMLILDPEDNSIRIFLSDSCVLPLV